MWKEAHPRRREKSGAGKQVPHKPPQATAEQLRIAQLVGDQNEDDIQLSNNVSKIVEVTGVSEEKALLALYDSNDDPSRAIELLLEKQSKGDDTGWEMAGRRKNRGANSATRGADDDSKEENTDKPKHDHGAVGRGRGRKGRVFDQNKTQDDKENESGQGGRRGGRGRSRSGPNRGRGRGAPRHNRNRVLGGKSDENSSSFNNGKDALQEPVDMWKGPGPGEECWEIEVGTWSSKDVQKQQQPPDKSADAYSGSWGTESWQDDLSESRVFQAQNQITVQAGNTSGSGGGVIKSEVHTNSDRMRQTPQTGERIDLGMLFKKSGTGDVRNPTVQSGPNYGGIVNVNMGHGKTAHSELTKQKAPDHVQPYQQSVRPPFGEPSAVAPSVTSRLFTDYEQPPHNVQSVSESLFQSDDTSNILKNSYPQLNGNVTLHNQSKNSSSFLDSFSGLGSGATQESQQSNILDQLSSLANTRQMPPYSQLGIPMSKDSQMRRQPPGHTTHAEATMANMETMAKNRDDDHLSFGPPLPPQVNQQSRQQRKKIAPITSKIPASAVEMPGNKGYGSQDYTPFSLQFGTDDATSIADIGSHEYGVSIPHSMSSGIMAQQSGMFINGDNSVKTSSVSHSSNNTDSLFSQTAKSEIQKMEERGNLPGVLDHTIKAPPGLNMPATAPSTLASLSTHAGTNNVTSGQHGSGFLPHIMPVDDKGLARSLDSSFHRPSSLSSSFSQDVSSYYVTSTSNHPSQSPKIQHGPNISEQTSHSPATPSGFPDNLSQSKSQVSSNNTEKLTSSTLETVSPSHSSNMSSLAASLNQVSMTQSMDVQNHSRGADTIANHSTVTSNTGPYSVVSTSENQSSSPPASANRNPGFNTVQGQASSSSYDNTVQNVMQNIRTSSDLSPMPHNIQQSQHAVTATTGSHTMAFKMPTPSTTSHTALGGFATAKMPPTVSNKANMNVHSGVTGPIQYGIPMAGLMPYAAPDMQYGYDQLLLAQSRVVNPLNFYDMHFHGNTQAASIDGQDSLAQMNQNLVGHGKYNRVEVSSSTPPTQMSLPGTVGSELSQHNSNIPIQAVPPKATQSTGHHTGHQQQSYVGAAMPAYANYSSLATPYYSLGMANAAGFQYPATMFAAAAMHQAPKHGASTTDGFQQPTARFNHTSAITSSSGLSDLSRPNYPKAHPSGLDKQQGYHQHTNTPPPFNLQTITAAVAGGGGAATGNAAPGLGPYAAPPYMALLQPHHASQQQTMHLLQHQHQDAGSGHSIGSQRNLGTNSLVKSAAKRGGYGSASSSYWGS